MLEEITEKCFDLLLQPNAPVSQPIRPDPENKYKTDYQRFAFLKSILDSEEFNEAVHKIISSPVTQWKDSETQKDIRAVRRIDNSALRQIANSKNRIDLPTNHPLKATLHSVPAKINITYKIETIDTPENRFVKYALNSFHSFIGEFRVRIKNQNRLSNEASLLESKLEGYLSHSIFKEIALPTTLSLNSPILQRKEGYREVLRVWLMFDLAAKLFWQGGEDVYSGDKKDVAVLYEYWLFFKLLDILKEMFEIEPKSIDQLIKQTDDGLGLQLRQGKHIPLAGKYKAKNRELSVEFSYNRAFSGKKNYPDSGSWTKNMRPDYTLTIWPSSISQSKAEEEELIVHIHFDAKYKIEKLSAIFGDTSDKELTENELQEELTLEKTEQNKGTFKRVDLLKMHSYKDAIRRTGGAYILYPGSQKYIERGFHEIIPGLGAFAINPSKQNDGSEELKKFLKEVVDHFLNRASQRENIASKVYNVHKEKKEDSDILKSPMPEYLNEAKLIPDDVTVLIGYYKTPEHLVWVLNQKRYNFRTGYGTGSLPLSAKELGAAYIVLHGNKNSKADKIYELKAVGPKIYSKQNLIDKQYPTDPTADVYIIFEIKKDVSEQFANATFDLTCLANFKNFRQSPIPITVTLSDLLKTVVE